MVTVSSDGATRLVVTWVAKFGGELWFVALAT